MGDSDPQKLTHIRPIKYNCKKTSARLINCCVLATLTGRTLARRCRRAAPHATTARSAATIDPSPAKRGCGPTAKSNRMVRITQLFREDGVRGSVPDGSVTRGFGEIFGWISVAYMQLRNLAEHARGVLFKTRQQRASDRAPTVIRLHVDRGQGRGHGLCLPEHVADRLITGRGNDGARQAAHPLFAVSMHRRLPRLKVLRLVIRHVGSFALSDQRQVGRLSRQQMDLVQTAHADPFRCSVLNAFVFKHAAEPSGAALRSRLMTVSGKPYRPLGRAHASTLPRSRLAFGEPNPTDQSALHLPIQYGRSSAAI
jgi:hypothetical protein